MLQFWLAVFIKTFWDSVEFIGQSKTGLCFAALVLTMTFIWLIRKHGLSDAFQHFWRTAGEGAVIAVVAFILVCVVHFLYEPHHLLDDMQARRDNVQKKMDSNVIEATRCNSDLKVELTKTGLQQSQLSSQQTVINSQQGTVDSLQGTLAKQQAAVTTCVGDLAKSIIPEPQRTTILRVSGMQKPPEGEIATQVLLLTNKNVTPVKIMMVCSKGGVVSVNASPAGGSASVIGAITTVPGYAFQIVMTMPAWSPDTPILLDIISKTDLVEANCLFQKM